MASTILVVDDEPPVRALLAAVFEDEGYEVRCAADGLAALAEAERARPDLIVADVMMPRLGGLGLLERLREGGDPTPVVFVSAARRVPERPGVAFVPKPFHLDRLLAVVADALAQARG